MKINEIIDTLEIAKAEVEWEYPMDYTIAINEAIKALEKQVPKKPKIRKARVAIEYCSSCGGRINPGGEYCIYCGQRIDWSEGE